MQDKIRLIEQYKQSHNIVDSVLSNNKTINSNNKTECIFHQDSNPSMQLYPKENRFYCFVCGNRGDILDYEMAAQGKSLEDIIGWEEDPREKRIEEYVKENLSARNVNGKDYSFDRLHFYYDEVDNIVSIKIIYKTADKVDKTALQLNITGNRKITKGKVEHEYLYNLPQVIRAKGKGQVIYILEGEKDCETVGKIGLTGTTTRNGAKSWKADYTNQLQGCNIVVIGDKDKAGDQYIKLLRQEVLPVSKTFKVVELPDLEEKQDITDWIEAGHNKDELKKLVYNALDLKLEREIKQYDYSDLGIANRFKDTYKDILKYAVDSKYYYQWDGKRWCQFDDELPVSTMALEFVQDLVKKIRQYTLFLKGDEEIAIYKKLTTKLKNDRIISMVSKRYKSFKDTHIKAAVLDQDVRFINCNNGIVDTVTGELLEHNKDLYITKLADTEYIPGKVNKLYKDGVKRLFNGDQEETEAFEMLIGYMLSGKANLKTFPIIHGVKNSGKSKLFEIILKTLGSDYVKTINKNLLMKQWDKNSAANPELAELRGVRLTICSETGDSDYFNTDLIKRIVGADTIKARPLYKPPIEFRPIFVPVIYTNDKPNFSGNDDALVNRLTLIELLYPLDKDKIDPEFETKIMNDKPGVFSYLMGLVVKFNAAGKLKKPQRWMESEEEYMKDNNIYLKFKELFLDEIEGHSVPIREIHLKFEEWFAETQSGVAPTRKRITIELKKILKITDTLGYPYARNVVMVEMEKPQKSFMSRVVPIK